MARDPSTPQLYVCTDCHGVYAGHRDARAESSHYHPPDDCAACGNASFAELEQLGDR